MVLMCDFNTFSGLVLCCKSARMSQITNDLQNWRGAKKSDFVRWNYFAALEFLRFLDRITFRDRWSGFLKRIV